MTDRKKKTPLWTCPGCGLDALALSNVDRNGSRQPGPGDYGLCEGCDALVCFVSVTVQPWQTRLVSEEEQSGLDAELRQGLQTARRDIAYKRTLSKTSELVTAWLFSEQVRAAVAPGKPVLAFRELPKNTTVFAYIDQVLDTFPANAAARRLCDFLIASDSGVTLMMLYATLQCEPEFGDRFRVDWQPGFRIDGKNAYLMQRPRGTQ